jgi:succinate dehydrogenase hydrophobic anchor subunit
VDIAERMDRFFIPKLEKIPVISIYAKTRGWPFILTWAHRIAGILLVLYVFFHIYTLTSLQVPETYDAKMRMLRLFFFVFLEWLLAIPVIFHALNGGRLILYEVFGNRNTEAMIRWLLGLALGYTLFLGLMMIMANQVVTPVFFWLCALFASVCAVYFLVVKIRSSGASLGWKLQRITGGFLLIMIPAHMLFMHLNPTVAHQAGVVIIRMQNLFIKLVDLSLVLCVLYHAGYGLYSITKDYYPNKHIHLLSGFLITAIMVFFGWVGVKLTIFI